MPFDPNFTLCTVPTDEKVLIGETRLAIKLIWYARVGTRSRCLLCSNLVLWSCHNFAGWSIIATIRYFHFKAEVNCEYERTICNLRKLYLHYSMSRGRNIETSFNVFEIFCWVLVNRNCSIRFSFCSHILFFFSFVIFLLNCDICIE